MEGSEDSQVPLVRFTDTEFNWPPCCSIWPYFCCPASALTSVLYVSRLLEQRVSFGTLLDAA